MKTVGLRSAPATAALGAVVAIMATASSARAGIVVVDQFRNDDYTHTGDGNSPAYNGAFFGARLTSDNPNEYDSVELSYSGPD